MTETTELLTCNICGKKFKSLQSHITYKHNMHPQEYKQLFPDVIFIQKQVLDKRSQHVHDLFVSGEIKIWNKGIHGYHNKYNSEVKKNKDKKISDGKKQWWDNHPEVKREFSLKLTNRNMKRTPENIDKIRQTVLNKHRNDPVYIQHFQEGRKKFIDTMKNKHYHFSSCEVKIRQILDEIVSDTFFHNSVANGIKIGGFTPDFISFKLQTIIEVYGDFWHRNTSEKDKRREAAYIANHFKLIIVWEHEIDNIPILKSRILKEIT